MCKHSRWRALAHFLFFRKFCSVLLMGDLIFSVSGEARGYFSKREIRRHCAGARLDSRPHAESDCDWRQRSRTDQTDQPHLSRVSSVYNMRARELARCCSVCRGRRRRGARVARPVSDAVGLPVCVCARDIVRYTFEIVICARSHAHTSTHHLPSTCNVCASRYYTNNTKCLCATNTAGQPAAAECTEHMCASIRAQCPFCPLVQQPLLFACKLSALSCVACAHLMLLRWCSRFSVLRRVRIVLWFVQGDRRVEDLRLCV